MQLSVCANSLSIFGGCSNVCACRCKVFFLFSRDINELTIAATTGTTQTTATSTAASARTTPIILTEANANVKYQMQAMTPFDDFVYLVNHVLLGEEPTIEDFILLVGTLVAFIAFILWCCFPIQPKDANNHRQFSCKTLHKQQQQQQNATESMAPTGGSSSSGASGGTFGTANISGRVKKSNVRN